MLAPISSKEAVMTDLNLTPEQEADAQRLAEVFYQKSKDDLLQMARLMVSKKDQELLGATEFEIRERVHKIGAFAIETAVNQRKKGGTPGRA
jgi:hypothetical protein